MQPQQSTRPGDTIFGRSWAIRLGGALLGASVIVAGTLAYDTKARAKLETIREETGVGDNAFVPIPETIGKPPPAVLTFRGQPLYPVSWARIPLRDTKLLRTGIDDSGRFNIYLTHEQLPAPASLESEKPGTTFYFLKVAEGEYIKTRDWSPGK